MDLESFCPYRAYGSYLFYPGCCPGLGASALSGRMGISDISLVLDPIKLQKIIFLFFKHPLPFLEALYSFLAKLSETFLCLFYTLFLVEMSLAEEFISIADYLLLHGFRQKILVRQWQLLLLDLLFRNAGTGVALAYPSMSLISFLAQQFGTQSAMTDVRLRTETVNARSIGLKDSDIVKHGCFLYKPGIQMQFGMRRNNL